MQEVDVSVRNWQYQPVLMNLRETAQFLGVGYRTALSLAHKSGFPAMRLGKKWVVHRDMLRVWLENQVKK